jgi:hypothetical protein
VTSRVEDSWPLSIGASGWYASGICVSVSGVSFDADGRPSLHALAFLSGFQQVSWFF